jgi:hypothetical protein
MNKIVIAALVSATAIVAVPAAAADSTTGTINITGKVGERCSVIEQGASQTFNRTIDLQRLDNDNGALRAELGSSTSASPADGLKVDVRVNCNTSNPTIGVSATRLSNGASDPGTGYSNTINYSASLKVKTQSAKTVEVVYATASDSSPVKKALGERIAAGSDNNVQVSVFGLAPDKASAQLAQGTYNSVVTVTIEPTA